MRGKWIRMGMVAVVLCSAAMSGAAQDTESEKKKPQPATSVHPQDTKTLESTLAALYNVISGPAGGRDWERFHALFIPEGHLTFSGKNDKGEMVTRVMSPTAYEKRAGTVFEKEAFYERSVANHVDRFGNIAQVFSTYESRHEKDGEPFARGINSIQLMWDGERWWIVSVLWDAERKDNPIPKQYLK